MTVIHPRISPTVYSAEDVISWMEKLLDRRHKNLVSRATFLRKWRGLRQALRATAEYRDFSARVRDRARGKCESCNGDGCLVHHEEPVARAPRRALDMTNTKWWCEPCHAEEHPWLKRKVSSR